MKLKCHGCDAENDFQYIIHPDNFVPFKFFECWYCGLRQQINAETGEVFVLETPKK